MKASPTQGGGRFASWRVMSRGDAEDEAVARDPIEHALHLGLERHEPAPEEDEVARAPARAHEGTIGLPDCRVRPACRALRRTVECRLCEALVRVLTITRHVCSRLVKTRTRAPSPSVPSRGVGGAGCGAGTPLSGAPQSTQKRYPMSRLSPWRSSQSASGTVFG